MVGKVDTLAKKEWTEEKLQAISQSFEGAEPQEIIRWSLDEFSPDITLACSFGGGSGMALLDMTLKINLAVSVFYLDTDFLFPETYILREQVSKRYGIQPIAFKAELTPQEQAERYGEALWARDPDLCCELRKVRPNAQALAGHRAWIAGLRRDQGGIRRNAAIVSWDTKFSLVKLNPLANWTEAQVWDYIKENEVPYNSLNDRGYPSLGCTFCTRRVEPGDHPRAGRWSGFSKMECGIHLPPTAGQAGGNGSRFLGANGNSRGAKPAKY